VKRFMLVLMVLVLTGCAHRPAENAQVPATVTAVREGPSGYWVATIERPGIRTLYREQALSRKELAIGERVTVATFDLARGISGNQSIAVVSTP
jgi:outer membrane lipopolysaccharide assembly protein LptE/RlpB